LAKHDKFVVSPHFHGAGHSPFRDSLIRLFKPFGRRTVEKADKIVVVSEYEKSLLRLHFGLDSSRIVVVTSGVNFSEFKGLRKKKRDFRSVLYVGRLESYKGVQYLIEVLPKISDDVVLEIVGKGSLKPFLVERARKLDVHDRVRFYQDLPRRSLLQKFVDADVFVLLSKYEAYSMVVAEALVTRTPCIVANTSALSEWVDHESCFGISIPLNLDGLGGLINKVLDCGVTEQAMKDRIGNKIVDWNDVVKRLADIYLE